MMLALTEPLMAIRYSPETAQSLLASVKYQPYLFNKRARNTCTCRRARNQRLYFGASYRHRERQYRPLYFAKYHRNRKCACARGKAGYGIYSF